MCACEPATSVDEGSAVEFEAECWEESEQDDDEGRVVTEMEEESAT